MKTTTLRLRAIRWKPSATDDDRYNAHVWRKVRWAAGERWYWEWNLLKMGTRRAVHDGPIWRCVPEKTA